MKQVVIELMVLIRQLIAVLREQPLPALSPGDPQQPAVVGVPSAPVHVDIPWILRYMGIGNSTFYAKVRNSMLMPVLRLGAREYYDREEVYDLFRRRGGESGKYRRD